jgi:hypothetical protein
MVLDQPKNGVGGAVSKAGLVVSLVLLSSLSVLAQSAQVQSKPLTDEDIKLFRQDVQSSKNEIIKDTMVFTQGEASAFWPVYKEYSQEQSLLADKRLKMITEYAQKLDKMDDATASSLTQQLFQTEDDTQALRRKYFDRFEKALGAKRAAKFYQVDNRLTMVVNIQLASEIPLIP